MPDLLSFKKNHFSQNGEDGIIARIFDRIGEGNRTCCEFGAWDGIYLSNCRQLVLEGWQAVMIEGDREKYQSLCQTYKDNDKVSCLNAYVDTGGRNLGGLLAEIGITDLDFLSIDIDGLDYEIFSTMKLRPRVVCVEINAGHSPLMKGRIDTSQARHNVGQPLGLFSETAEQLGYSLVGYSGNGFYVRNDALIDSGIDKIHDEEAYLNFLEHLDEKARSWLYLVNRGIVGPQFFFHNDYLTRKRLNLEWAPIFKEMVTIFRKLGLLATTSLLVRSQIAGLSRRQGFV